MSTTSCPIAYAFILYPFILLIPFATSRENGYELNPFQVGRIFFQSADAPMTKELAKLQPVVDAADLILTHINRIENKIMASIITGKVPGPNDDIRPCNHKEPNFERGAGFTLGVRGWPFPKFPCVSDVFGADLTASHVPEDQKFQYTGDDLYEAMNSRGKVMKDNVKSIARKAASNFTDPDVFWNFPYETTSQRCVLHPASAFRIGDKWYFNHAITNAPKNTQLPLLSRQIVGEYPRVENGTLGDPKLMCLPVRPEKGEVHENRTDTTTFIASFRRNARPSFVTDLPIDENPAILRSLDDSDLFVQQAQDALTASNLAILALPLALNLVPVALLAEVSTVSMLIYTLMSDVLTVIPLGIKGVELIIIGRQRHRSVFVRITGASNGTQLEAAAAEIHAAECRILENVTPAGILFLVLAITFLVGGIVAEFVARSYRMKRSKSRLEELKNAKLGLSSKGSSRSASVPLKQDSPPSSFTALHLESQVVGSPFRNGSFSESYDSRKGDKSE